MFFPSSPTATKAVLCLAKGSLAITLALSLAQCSSGPKGEVVVSVQEQKMGVYEGGHLKKSYPVSTSKFGIGDQPNSYRTPLGKHEVIAKIGHGLPKGAVLKSRSWNGEVLKPNAPGRDPIVSRILWLRGMESTNKNAQKRFIYIHGTTEECNLGKPASYGCIRMGMGDVVEVFNEIGVGAKVIVTKGGLPHGTKAEPAPADAAVVAASSPEAAASPASAAPAAPAADPKTTPAPATVAPAPVEVAQVEEKPARKFGFFGRKKAPVEEVNTSEPIEVTEFAKVRTEAPGKKSASSSKPKSEGQPQPQIKIGPEAPSPESLADAKLKKEAARTSSGGFFSLKNKWPLKRGEKSES